MESEQFLNMEAQAQAANVDLVLILELHDFNFTVGYFREVESDAAQGPGIWFRSGFSDSLFELSDIFLNYFSTDPSRRLTAMAVPLGSGRRIARDVTTLPYTVAAPPGPANVRLGALVPNTAHTPVPQMTSNWSPGQGLAFTGGLFNTQPSLPEIHVDPFPRTMRLFQYGLKHPGNAVNYGVPDLRHEAPRRFRVSGDFIERGARLRIYMPNQVLPSGFNPSGPLSQVTDTTLLEIPIYPTGEVDANNGNRPVWESAVEIAPYHAYVLMLGGYYAPGVADAIRSSVANTWNEHSFGGGAPLFNIPFPAHTNILEPSPGTNFGDPGEPANPFNPDAANYYWVEVVNVDSNGTPTAPGVGSPGWQRIVMM